ncbi:MAG: pyruvate kinase [Firmicutes bacterium]|nr:pyruvate kinase [Bacillota bacterium]
MIPFNQTKIICTIGPASDEIGAMRKLINAGMDVMRMNFSHGDHDQHFKRLQTLYKLNKELGTNVASLLDTKGPEIRTHLFRDGKVTIKDRAEVTVHMEEVLGDEENISVTYETLYQDVKPGDFILVDDGYLALEVKSIDKENKLIHTISKNEHTIKNRRGINVPGVQLHLDFISEKDKEDIIWGCKNNVDFIAASFVRRASDIEEIRSILKEYNKENIQIISKIENKEGVRNIDSIIEASDGIMIARGDLGVEVPAEDVPVIQKMIIAKCHVKGKISVTATQMLESMIEHPRPTRAEVSDVANAIYDGTDAIMLSGESAIGKYPVESVEVMNHIAVKIEKQLDRSALVKRANSEKGTDDTIETSIAVSVAYTVIQSNIDLIIAPSVSGFTPRLISKFRPDTKIVALVPSAEKARSLALNNGVEAVQFELVPDTEVLIKRAVIMAKEVYGCKKGNRVLITGGFPIGAQTNSFRILDIE